MPLIVGIRFRPATKMYYFGAENIPDLATGDYVMLETSRGEEAGLVVQAPTQIPPEDVTGELKPVQRRATSTEIRDMYKLREREPAILERCRELTREHRLDMKMLRAEYNYDGSRLLFYFTSEARVDFRDLVRALARTFKTRIDLHQVGVRDEAKLVGSLGICGRLLCCRDWLPEFNKVSIRMAKHQNLSLNPLEISGACGRLLCCLAYEDDYYTLMKGILPKRGQTVRTAEGEGVVLDANVITERVTVRLVDDRILQVQAAEIEYDPNVPEPKQGRRR
jgi:cell fate regulator YaaT (PSP1 superfamily)